MEYFLMGIAVVVIIMAFVLLTLATVITLTDKTTLTKEKL